jgi:hypothetical protein
MTTNTSSTDPEEDTAPETPEDAVDSAIAEPAAEDTESSDTDVPVEGGAATDDTDPPSPAPAAPTRPTPVGAVDVAGALRAARAEQRMADGTAPKAATPAPVAAPATSQAADPAHPALDPVATDDIPAPTADTASAAPPAEEPAAEEQTAPTEEPAALPTTYEAFVDTLSEPLRALVDGHISGLKTALQAERAVVKKLEAQVKTAQSLADERAKADADAKTQLEADMASARAEVAAAQRRAAFYETALEQGIRRKSVRLAYLAALDAGHIGADGQIAWEAIRSSFSDLFESAGRMAPTPPSRSSSAAAGAGARGDTPAVPTLNQIIRNAAGRR